MISASELQEIKTMKKDLARLREADIVKESKKIIKSDLPDKAPTKKIEVKPLQQENDVDESPAFTHRKIEVIEIDKEKVEKYGNELEKQKLFLLQSKLKDLKNKLQELKTKQESPLMAQKNKLELQKSEAQKELLRLKDQKPGKSWLFKKKSPEKKTWQTENKIKELENEITNLNQELGKVAAQQESVGSAIKGANSSAKEIYKNIKQREAEIIQKSDAFKSEPASEPKSTVEKFKEEVASPRPKSGLAMTKPKEQTAPTPLQEQKTSPLLQGQGPKQSVTSSFRGVQTTKQSQKEKVARKKFLEEVEEWAKSNKQF